MSVTCKGISGDRHAMYTQLIQLNRLGRKLSEDSLGLPGSPATAYHNSTTIDSVIIYVSDTGRSGSRMSSRMQPLISRTYSRIKEMRNTDYTTGQNRIYCESIMEERAHTF